MKPIHVEPSKFRNFGEPQGVFCLVTSEGMGSLFEVARGGGYEDALVLEYGGDRSFESFLASSVPEDAHVLVVLPDSYFRSPSPAHLGSRRKLAVMACSSTATSFDAVRHFLQMGERTDPELQVQMTEDLFARGQAAERLHFVDDAYGTEAVFEHLGNDLSWHEQAGYLGWGEQQLFPAGEISVLPVEVFEQNIDRQFAINGAVALRGIPVLHAGTPSYLPADQERLFAGLSTLGEEAVIAHLEAGRFTRFEPAGKAAAPAARMLEALCEVDSRYRTLVEIGFGINTTLEPFAGNSAMNEVFGGTAGAVHLGIGLTPYTQYHLDVVCPELRVEDTRGNRVFGPTRHDAGGAAREVARA